MATAKSKNIPAFIITAEPGKATEELKGTSLASLMVLTCDYKTIEMAARAPAVLYLLEKGTVRSKWSSPCFSKSEKQLSQLPVQNAASVQVFDLTNELVKMIDTANQTIDKTLKGATDSLGNATQKIMDTLKIN